jgi:hypothetical protein
VQGQDSRPAALLARSAGSRIISPRLWAYNRRRGHVGGQRETEQQTWRPGFRKVVQFLDQIRDQLWAGDQSSTKPIELGQDHRVVVFGQCHQSGIEAIKIFVTVSGHLT